MCGSPNVLQTHGWKYWGDSIIGTSECGGINSVNCGLYCASSKVICAKVTLGLINKVYKVYTRQMTLSKAFYSEFSPSYLISLLRSPYDWTNDQNNETRNFMVSNLKLIESFNDNHDNLMGKKFFLFIYIDIFNNF